MQKANSNVVTEVQVDPVIDIKHPPAPNTAILCLARRVWSQVNRGRMTGVFTSTWATPCRGSETTP